MRSHRRPRGEGRSRSPPPPLAYLALAALRVLLLLAPGYIHPDEYFQGGQELFASLVLGVPGCLIPWEFHPQHALRSVAFPWLIAGLPFEILKRMVGPLLHRLGLVADPRHVITGRVLLYAPRLLMVGLSFVQDWCIYQLVSEQEEAIAKKAEDAVKMMGPWEAVTVFAAAWPTLLLSARPFSNTVESVLLALALWTHLSSSSSPYRRRLGLGACFALGCFVRFTFPAFGFPIGIAELWAAWRHKELRACILQLAAGIVLVAGPMALADSWFYGHFTGTSWEHRPSSPFLPTLTPWNALRYNALPANLAHHGIHPRITHLLVNFPLLFSTLGPAVLARQCIFPSPPAAGTQGRRRLTCLAVVLCGVGCLSLAPHQEPRFLLPLGVPLVLLLALSERGGEGLKPTWPSLALRGGIKAIFLLQTVLCLLFFGGLHQAGVVPALLHLEASLRSLPSDTDTDTDTDTVQAQQHVFFHKTYMPPRFLLAGATASTSTATSASDKQQQQQQQQRQQQQQQQQQSRIIVTDLGGAHIDNDGNRAAPWVTQAEATGRSVLVVAPASIPSLISGEVIASAFPHLSTEDLPASLYEMALKIWRIDPPAPPQEQQQQQQEKQEQG